MACRLISGPIDFLAGCDIHRFLRPKMSFLNLKSYENCSKKLLWLWFVFCFGYTWLSLNTFSFLSCSFFLSWDNRSLTINLESSFTIHFFLYGPTTASFYNFDICSFTRRNSTIPLWDSLLISHDCCLISGQDGAFYTALPQIAGRHCL